MIIPLQIFLLSFILPLPPEDKYIYFFTHSHMLISLLQQKCQAHACRTFCSKVVEIGT